MGGCQNAKSNKKLNNNDQGEDLKQPEKVNQKNDIQKSPKKTGEISNNLNLFFVFFINNRRRITKNRTK